MNTLNQDHTNVGALTTRQLATSDANRDTSPFRNYNPITEQNQEVWEFRPNLTHQTSMTFTSCNLDQPSVTSIERSDVKISLNVPRKRTQSKVKLPQMTNSIYERKRIVNVKEFARKSRYMLKMRDFAHLDS